jgi:hypothetical protein
MRVAKPSWVGRQRYRRSWTATLAVVLVVGAVVLVVGTAMVLMPRWLVTNDAAGEPLAGAERVNAVNQARGTMLQLLGGLVLGAGAVATWRQLRVAREGQVTERFTRAVDQLGRLEVDVRIGGIYGLERIARDSAVDRIMVTEVLTAFVRQHAPWPPRTPSDDLAGGAIRTAVGQLRRRMPDVHAAMTVLGRAHWRDRSVELQLNDTDLRGAFLPHADLQGYFLWEVHLEGARLSRSDFSGAFLGNAHLREASLRDSELDGADLQGADLRGARLAGARLARAKLDGVDLRDATDDARTTWPPGFDRVAAGIYPEQPAHTPTAER